MTVTIGLYSQGSGAGRTTMPQAMAFRVLLGVGDTEPTVWDGSVKVSQGKIDSIQGWRFAEADSTDGRSSWRCSSGFGLTQIGAQQNAPPPVLENGVLIGAAGTDPGTRFDISTKQGDFSFTAAEVPLGAPKRFLGGRITVDRVPNTLQLTSSAEDQDFPASAQAGDDLWVTYVEFVRGDRKQHRWGQMGEDPPKDFSFVSRPAGGDQVFLMRYSKSKQTWSAPIPATDAKQDIMRAAVGVDGRKRVWVVYSANRGGNFDIYAKAYSGGRWGKEMRLTNDPGTDIYPVAAADAAGRVWVTWQAFRNDNLDVLAAAQQGDKFSQETVVSFSKASDWDPSIAAAPNGEVAVSWDTYDKGDYDVYFRRLRYDSQVRMEEPVAVAASTRFEARSSAAYDRQNRLWVAYETSDAKWGKDTGPYERYGVPLYRNHDVGVRVFQGPQAYTAAAESLARVLPASSNPNQQGQQKLNSFPVLAAGIDGGVYIAFRTRVLPGRTPAGTVWMEHLAWYDGAEWRGPIAVPGADQWIENRPAMAPLGPGNLMMVLAGDHRIRQTIRRGQRGERLADAVNADIFASQLLLSGQQAPKLEQAAVESVSPPDPDAGPEREHISLMRRTRASAGGQQLQLLRGEFHRHTDVSGDGTGDGPLIDAYRYMIDAADMDWGGCCDHDNGTGEYPWWIQQKLTDAYKLGQRYVSMFSYERSVSYPEGHRNVVFENRGVRPIPRLPKMADDSTGSAPDTQLLYEYLRKYDGIVAVHTSGTNMGTDWRDNDPKLEPVVEIYQGCRQNYEMPGAPRTNTAEYSIGGWRPLGFVSLALKKGYRLAFQASSDHGSTHISYCNLWVANPTRAGILEAFKKRRVYGATDNILADVRCGAHFMGEEFTTTEPPSLSVKLNGTANFAKVHVIKDGEYVYSVEPGKREVELTWRDNAAVKGKTSYYYVRGEQSDGEVVWVSPMWITYN
jgi:hypothetical protein